MIKIAFVALLFGFSLSKSIAAESLIQSHSPVDYFFPDDSLNSRYFLNESSHKTSRQVPIRDESGLEILFTDDSVKVPELMIAYKAELLANLIRINAKLDFCNVDHHMVRPNGQEYGVGGRGSGTGNFDECIGFGQETGLVITGVSLDYQTEDKYGMARISLRTRVEPWLLHVYLLEYAK